MTTATIPTLTILCEGCAMKLPYRISDGRVIVQVCETCQAGLNLRINEQSRDLALLRVNWDRKVSELKEKNQSQLSLLSRATRLLVKALEVSHA